MHLLLLDASMHALHSVSAVKHGYKICQEELSNFTILSVKHLAVHTHEKVFNGIFYFLVKCIEAMSSLSFNQFFCTGDSGEW